MAAISRRILLLLILKRRLAARQKYRKRMWVRKLFMERKNKGEFHLLVADLRLHDSEYFFKYFRMTPVQYEELLLWVAPLITKSSQKREAIGPSERLSVTLKVSSNWRCSGNYSFFISYQSLCNWKNNR